MYINHDGVMVPRLWNSKSSNYSSSKLSSGPFTSKPAYLPIDSSGAYSHYSSFPHTIVYNATHKPLQCTALQCVLKVCMHARGSWQMLLSNSPLLMQYQMTSFARFPFWQQMKSPCLDQPDLTSLGLLTFNHLKTHNRTRWTLQPISWTLRRGRWKW